jgi:hypothetical protein
VESSLTLLPGKADCQVMLPKFPCVRHLTERHWKLSYTRIFSDCVSSISEREGKKKCFCAYSEASDACHGFCRDFVAATSENSTFDLNQGLADTVFRRNGLSLHEYLEVPEHSEPPSPTSATDLFQISENEDSVLENSVPMQLLNQAEQERAGEYVCCFVFPSWFILVLII